MMFHSVKYDKELLEDLFNLNLFSSKSPALYHYHEQTDLWCLFKESITDETLIKLMIFNLSFNIAPLHTYIEYYSKELQLMKLSRYDKQCIGSIVVIIFISLGYKKTKRVYRGKSIIKYASYFKLKEEGK